MIIAFGNDHAGYPLKSDLLSILAGLEVEIIDHGSYDPDPVDFPDIARLVCNSVRQGKADRGILLCGTGIGAAIAANKLPGIRAGVCHDVHSAHQGVEHDDMNVLCLGGKIIGAWLARDIVESFVGARFSDDVDLRRRVQKLADIELEAARELIGCTKSG
ncbi:MAG: ribose 5-phosphate isomerase B [Chloroflexi bacterium]|nr:ribose 5-phosphate isomerase B [Chloroflexota bacterium]